MSLLDKGKGTGRKRRKENWGTEDLASNTYLRIHEVEGENHLLCSALRMEIWNSLRKLQRNRIFLNMMRNFLIKILRAGMSCLVRENG